MWWSLKKSEVSAAEVACAPQLPPCSVVRIPSNSLGCDFRCDEDPDQRSTLKSDQLMHGQPNAPCLPPSSLALMTSFSTNGGLRWRRSVEVSCFVPELRECARDSPSLCLRDVFVVICSAKDYNAVSQRRSAAARKLSVLPVD